MKRIIALAIMAAFVLSAGMASAAEVKLKGQFDHLFQWTDKVTNFQKNSGEKDFKADQRIRLYFDYVASENVHGVVGFEISSEWGGRNGGTGNTWGADATGAIKVKHAYTNFSGGGFGLTAGLQSVALPSAVAGSPILGDDVFGVLASYAVSDNFSLVGGWVRLRGADTWDESDVDAAAIIAPLSFDGFSLAPYFVYAWVGERAAVNNVGNAGVTAHVNGLASMNATQNTKSYNAWWLGTSFNLTMFDPIVLMADIMYGKVNADKEQNNRDGFYMIAELDYKMDMFTPGLLFMYGTGEDDDATNGSESMPIITNGGSFAPVSLGAPGGSWESTDTLLGTTDNLGLMALGVVAKDISFLENLSHTARLVYFKGTADKKYGDAQYPGDSSVGNTVYLTEKDNAWEVDFDSTYQIYENLSLLNQINYIKLNRDDSNWNNANDYKDAWKASLALQYRF